jgi:hypothetical protein
MKEKWLSRIGKERGFKPFCKKKLLDKLHACGRLAQCHFDISQKTQGNISFARRAGTEITNVFSLGIRSAGFGAI